MTTCRPCDVIRLCRFAFVTMGILALTMMGTYALYLAVYPLSMEGEVFLISDGGQILIFDGSLNDGLRFPVSCEARGVVRCSLGEAKKRPLLWLWTAGNHRWDIGEGRWPLNSYCLEKVRRFVGKAQDGKRQRLRIRAYWDWRNPLVIESLFLLSIAALGLWAFRTPKEAKSERHVGTVLGSTL